MKSEIRNPAIHDGAAHDLKRGHGTSEPEPALIYILGKELLAHTSRHTKPAALPAPARARRFHFLGDQLTSWRSPVIEISSMTAVEMLKTCCAACSEPLAARMQCADVSRGLFKPATIPRGPHAPRQAIHHLAVQASGYCSYYAPRIAAGTVIDQAKSWWSAHI